MDEVNGVAEKYNLFWFDFQEGSRLPFHLLVWILRPSRNRLRVINPWWDRNRRWRKMTSNRKMIFLDSPHRHDPNLGVAVSLGLQNFPYWAAAREIYPGRRNRRMSNQWKATTHLPWTARKVGFWTVLSLRSVGGTRESSGVQMIRRQAHWSHTQRTIRDLREGIRRPWVVVPPNPSIVPCSQV